MHPINHLMPHGRSPALPGLFMGGLGLGDALVEDLGVLVLDHRSAVAVDGNSRVTYGSILGGFGATALKRHAVTLVLEALGSDKALDTRGLGVWLLALALGLDFTTDDKLANLYDRYVRLNPLKKGLAKKL